ncbi:hypothetical protein G6F66_015689 [Rhizopus arrhizus]|nr:hypothetical protein G6F66_015689 [Rhizopus arrhizus]
MRPPCAISARRSGRRCALPPARYGPVDSPARPTPFLARAGARADGSAPPGRAASRPPAIRYGVRTSPRWKS